MGAQEELPGANSVSCRTDASTCMAAAMRLRNRPMWRSSRDELRRSAATSQLLEALGRALAGTPRRPVSGPRVRRELAVHHNRS
jgi:hypothetical protein